MSIILVYMAAVLVSVILERQERRHRFERQMEYIQLEKTLPIQKPKLPRLESWLNVMLGLLITLLGVLMAFSVFHTHTMVRTETRIFSHDAYLTLAVFIATGITLLILGFKSIRLNKEYDAALKSQSLRSQHTG